MKQKIVFVNDNPPGAADQVLPAVLAQAILNRLERDRQERKGYINSKAS